MSRRAIALVALAAVAVVVLALILLRGSGDGKGSTGVADPLAEALGYAPASAQVVGAIDVAPDSQQGAAVRDLARTFPVARFAAEELRTGVRSLGLDPDEDLPAVLGGPLVIAGDARTLSGLSAVVGSLQAPDLPALLRTGAVAAISGRSADDMAGVVERAKDTGRWHELPRDGAPSGVRLFALPNSSGVVGVREADLVMGADAARVVRAFALRDRGGGMTRATFARRLGPLAGPALVRIAADPRLLLAARAGGTPFVDALRGGAVALRVESPGLRIRANLATDPSKVTDADLPLAPGPAPPSPAGGPRPVSAGVRNLAQTIHVLDASRNQLRLPLVSSVTGWLDTLDQIKGPLKTFGRIDVDAALIDQLTGTTTFTAEPNGIAIRGELRDGGPLRTALNRIAAIPDVAISLAHVTDLDLDTSGDQAYEVRRNGTTFLRVAVLGNVLVATTDLHAGLRAIAARRPQRASRPGALAFHAAGASLQNLIVQRLGLPGLARLVLGGIGDLDGSAISSRSGMLIDAALHLAT